MSRFHQRLRKDLKDPEFAVAFYDMSVDIALLQVLEQARKALNVSEKELAERMGGTMSYRDAPVQRFSCKPDSRYHLSYTSGVRTKS